LLASDCSEGLREQAEEEAGRSDARGEGRGGHQGQGDPATQPHDGESPEGAARLDGFDAEAAGLAIAVSN